MMPIETLADRVGRQANAIILSGVCTELKVAIWICCRPEKHAALQAQRAALEAAVVAAAIPTSEEIENPEGRPVTGTDTGDAHA